MEALVIFSSFCWPVKSVRQATVHATIEEADGKSDSLLAESSNFWHVLQRTHCMPYAAALIEKRGLDVAQPVINRSYCDAGCCELPQSDVPAHLIFGW